MKTIGKYCDGLVEPMKLTSGVYTSESGWSIQPFLSMDSPNTLVLVFGAPEFINDHKALDELKSTYPQSHIVGCSTAGEILGSKLYDHSLVATITQFEKTTVAVATAPVVTSHDSFNAGRALAATLKRPDLRAVLIFSEGSHVNGTELINGCNLPASVAITGGLAGDGDRFQRTWVINEGKAQTDMVVAVGLYGSHLSVAYGSRSGWDPSGIEWSVTRSQDNVLYELNGQPALALYKTVLDAAAAQLPASALRFPLALRANAEDNTPIIRTILAIDEPSQSMVFAGDVPQGYLAQLMTANLDKLITSAAEATVTTKELLQADAPALCVAVSCVGRRLVLGDRSQQELEAVLKAIPGNPHQIGFYSYGEISPSGGYCDLHNQTMTITAFQEN
jgi:hypothetical protein